jgi:disulfide bond formation protein DsbB
MVHAVTVLIAVFGLVGQVVLLVLALAGVLSLVGATGPLDTIRGAVWGYELWLAFLVSASATAGSLFFSEIANFVPCELCWYQRICMFPLSILTLLIAIANDQRAARYLLPLPVVGACIAVYHLLIEHGVVGQSTSCSISAPGGCATKWVDEFGYLTIPALTLTAFLLVTVFLLLATFDLGPEPAEA